MHLSLKNFRAGNLSAAAGTRTIFSQAVFILLNFSDFVNSFAAIKEKMRNFLIKAPFIAIFPFIYKPYLSLLNYIIYSFLIARTQVGLGGIRGFLTYPRRHKRKAKNLPDLPGKAGRKNADRFRGLSPGVEKSF